MKTELLDTCLQINPEVSPLSLYDAASLRLEHAASVLLAMANDEERSAANAAWQMVTEAHALFSIMYDKMSDAKAEE